MRFTDTPTRLMRVRYGGHFPGLGHQITTLCYALKYCQDNGLYPVLKDDPGNAYGRWTDYFEPFWNETQHRRIIERAATLEVVENDLEWAANRTGLFGDDWTGLAGEIKAIFLRIFVLRESVRKDIERKMDRLRLPPGYSSLHVRRGAKNRQFKDYGALSDKEIVRRAEEMLRTHHVEDVSLNIFTLCRESYLGRDIEVRNTPGHTLDLLTEIVVALNAENHFQTVGSRVSKMLRLLRDDRNCHHVFEVGDTQYTSL